MTQIFPVKVKCPICKNEMEIYNLMSTNRFGAPDLDLRPPEMMRSTMNTWTKECNNCGYVSHDFKEKPIIDREFLETESYKNCDGFDFENNLSRIFYRESLINNNDVDAQFYSLLHCAWACDDVNDVDNAIEIRKKAVELIDIMIDSDNNVNLKLTKADLMRRALMFEAVIEEYSNMDLNEEFLNEIIEFQLIKAKEKDAGCYTTEDVQKSYNDSFYLKSNNRNPV